MKKIWKKIVLFTIITIAPVIILVDEVTAILNPGVEIHLEDGMEITVDDTVIKA